MQIRIASDTRVTSLAMSPAERKRLDINKSTLWYQKKQLAAGKSVKIYSKMLAKLA